MMCLCPCWEPSLFPLKEAFHDFSQAEPDCQHYYFCRVKSCTGQAWEQYSCNTFRCPACQRPPCIQFLKCLICLFERLQARLESAACVTSYIELSREHGWLVYFWWSCQSFSAAPSAFLSHAIQKPGKGNWNQRKEVVNTALYRKIMGLCYLALLPKWSISFGFRNDIHIIF